MPQNVIDLLTADHREVEEMVDELLASQDAQRRRELADAVIGALVRHSVAEETIVYPIMSITLPDGEKAVGHDKDEHRRLEGVLKEMEGAEAGGPDFFELVSRLRSVLADHVSDEENEQFPQLRAKVDDKELEAMGLAVAALKKVAPTRPHPNAPNNALFHLTVGPGVGLVDRLRDALAGRTNASA